MAAASMFISRTRAASAPILSLAATDFDQAFVRRSHLKCGRPIPVILFGAARRMSPTFRRQRAKPCFPTSHSFWATSFRRWATRFRGLTTNCASATGAIISPGIALPPQYLDCLRHVEQPFFTPVYDFCSPRLAFGRVALVGDAASTPRPHIGFGVSKAGAEAQALAEALSNYDDVDRALTAYNSVRQPLSERIVAHGRKLGMRLGVGTQTNEDRAFAKLLQSPRGILDWIAVPNFLYARP